MNPDPDPDPAKNLNPDPDPDPDPVPDPDPGKFVSPTKKFTNKRRQMFGFSRQAKAVRFYNSKQTKRFKLAYAFCKENFVV